MYQWRGREKHVLLEDAMHKGVSMSHPCIQLCRRCIVDRQGRRRRLTTWPGADRWATVAPVTQHWRARLPIHGASSDGEAGVVCCWSSCELILLISTSHSQSMTDSTRNVWTSWCRAPSSDENGESRRKKNAWASCRAVWWFAQASDAWTAALPIFFGTDGLINKAWQLVLCSF
jgi:hypothetical protein